MNRLFRDNGLSGMIEAKGYKMIDHISPFLEPFWIGTAVIVLNAPITKVFCMYVDLKRLQKYKSSSFWDGLRLYHATDSITKVQKNNLERLWGLPKVPHGHNEVAYA